MKEIKKYFTHKNFGGYSDCIYGSDLKTQWWKGATIPNCVGAAWGFFNLDRGTGKSFRRLYGDAGSLYAKGCKDGSGFLCGYEPKNSSIAVYGAGTKAGHVTYVLHVFGNGQAIVLESNYSGTMSNGRGLRVKFGNPKTMYKEYHGCIYDFT